MLSGVLARVRLQACLVALRLLCPLGDGGLSFCNPSHGYRYLALGNGGPLNASYCTASWDIHEVEVFTSLGKHTIAAATAPTGHDNGYGPELALDGDLGTFFAGDHDVNMACSCWSTSSKDGQLLLLDLGSRQEVTRIRLHQGGDSNDWAISKLRIHCGSDPSEIPNSLPLELDISMETTLIDCSSSGCVATGSTPHLVNLCASATAVDLQPTYCPPESASGGTAYMCNPYDGYRYLALSNGGPLLGGDCRSSWDIYEVEVFSHGRQLDVRMASAPTGSASPDAAVLYFPFSAVDGKSSTYWAGDHDTVMACDCENAGRMDNHLLLLDLGEPTQVTEIKIHQGGADDLYAVSELRIHCAQNPCNIPGGLAGGLAPLEVGISLGTTGIACSASGCSVGNMSTPYRSVEAELCLLKATTMAPGSSVGAALRRTTAALTFLFIAVSLGTE